MKDTWQERFHEWKKSTGKDFHEQHSKGDGWSHRGYLPHFNSSSVIQSITFGLVDALPKDVIKEFLDETSGKEVAADRRRRIEGLLDSGHGCCALKEERVAQALKDSILKGSEKHYYDLHAWVIMPNHVHALLQSGEGITLGRIVKAWKRAAWDACRDHLGRRGQLWNDDYWDRRIRDEKHYNAAKRYIVNNPVKAGLAKDWSEWKWVGLYQLERDQ